MSKKNKMKTLFQDRAREKRVYALDIDLVVNTGVKRFDELQLEGLDYLASMIAKRRGYNVSSFVSEVMNSVRFRRELLGL